MAKRDKRRRQEQQQAQASSTDSQSSSKSTKTRMDRIRENKPLFGIVVLIALIILAAIGVGAYYAIDSITSDDTSDDNTEEVASNQDEDSDESEASDMADEGTEDEETGDSNEEEQDESTEDTSEDEQNDESENDQNEDNSSDDSSDNSNDEDNQEDSQPSSSGHSQAGLATSDAVREEIARTGIWRPVDYNFGDITESPYTVQPGDTLWEIAEGYYGSGFQWTEILSSNSGSIGFLPTGEQSLIYPGTSLNLP